MNWINKIIKMNKEERKIVVPGEIIVSGEKYLPGDFTIKNKEDIIANRYGLVDFGERIVKIIPISGIFEPRRGNVVIGTVRDISFNGYNVEIGGPYSAFLPIMECPRFVNKENLLDFAKIGDSLAFRIVNIKKPSIDLGLKSRNLGKLNDGRIIKINSHKVPRVIGKEGSMINLIKEKTNTEITVGQNGFIWIKGELENEEKARDAIKLIEKESIFNGLTQKVEEFLKIKEK